MKMESEILKKIEELKEEITKIKRDRYYSLIDVARLEAKMEILQWAANLSDVI